MIHAILAFLDISTRIENSLKMENIDDACKKGIDFQKMFQY